MDVSIIICTRDRAASLDIALRSIAAMRNPEGLSWELVIVDNGSTDITSDVIAEHATHIPIVRVFEPTAGLSHARNAGVRCARGRYIVWTDDDVRVDENWLCAYARAFAEHPDAAVFGGCVIPTFEEPQLPWFRENQYELGTFFANCVVDGPTHQFVLGERQPVGANYAVCAEVQKKHQYDPAFGRAPGRMRVAEETVLVKAILKDGGKGYWVPASKVFHLIPISRQKLSYIWLRCMGNGETYMLTRELAGERVSPKVILRHVVKVVAYSLLYLLKRTYRPPLEWMRHFKAAAFHAGIVGYFVSADHRNVVER